MRSPPAPRADAGSDRPSLPDPQYEEARKAHIRRLQADLARGATDSIVANSFQFNPEPSKEERIGLKQ
jgi:hypothetical protein